MKFTDFLDERGKALHAFFDCDQFSFKDVTTALNLDDAAKLVIQRISTSVFGPQSDDGKRKMRRFTGDELLAFCVACSLVKSQLASADDVPGIFTTLTAGVDGDDEFARNGDVQLSQAPAKAVEVLQQACLLTQVWYNPNIMLVCSPLMDGGASSWKLVSAPTAITSPATIVLLKDALIPMIARLSEKYEIPELTGSGSLQVSVAGR